MPDMTIVNTSPIFYLHRLGLLNIFHALYGEIIVPWAVQDELEQGRKQGENVPNLDEYSWIKIRNVSVPQYMNLIVELGRGESEVLGVAAEHPSALVVLDDKLARNIAELQGFRLTGTAGILLRAKEKNLISEIKPVLDSLIDLDFRLRPELLKNILDIAGE